MGVSSFLKNLFGSAKGTATTLTNKADDSFIQTKEKLRPYLEKVEDYTVDVIEKARETVAPYLDKAELLAQETFVNAKESAGPYIEKTKSFATESFETIKENAAPIVENIESLATQTKEKVNEYADKAEEILENIKSNFDDKAETNTTIANAAADIEVIKIENIEQVLDKTEIVADSFDNAALETSQKLADFPENNENSIVENVQEIKYNNEVEMNNSDSTENLSKKTDDFIKDSETKAT
ncbi:MAG: hypothetical protein I4O51_08860 [Flavobacterium micromati]|jgi:hypothetical protein|nr:hypothetical protein [Flavobacterium micromati]